MSMIEKHGSGQRGIFYRIWRRMAVWAALAAIAVCSLVIIRSVLLRNAQKMGNEMAHSYCVEGERNMIMYEAMMRLSTRYIDQQLQESSDPERWIRSYLQTVSNTMGENVIDPYAVIDGRIVAANPWDGDEGYDIAGTEWYQKALEADGEIVFTDGYQDAITGSTVITLAQEGEVEGNVVAFDIFPEQFRIAGDNNSLPEGSYYFLCDSTGTLLYDDTNRDFSQEERQEYMDTLFSKIREGSFEQTNAYIHNPGGEKLAAYYDVAENGWISIITMPYSSLLSGVREISLWYAVILTIFLVIFVIMSVREHLRDKNYSRISDTVRVLGNSYYAIYRMDFSSGTYDMIKGSEYVRQRIPVKGNYDLLMRTMGEVMRPEVFEEFRESFSVENIRKLVSQQTRDYGGDFQRRFGEEYRWVNVRLLFDASLNPSEAVLCFKEVDEEKQGQLRQLELLKEALQSAKESEEAKNAFFSNMSHDMRTPLNAILGLSQLAKEHVNNPQKMGEYMDKIHFSSSQLLGLINDILEISRLENGKITLDNKHFHLGNCIRSIADIFQAQAQMDGKHFSVETDIRTAQVYGDVNRLSQILNNLLSNALKFSSSGDSICLSVREIEQGEYARYQFVVRDTGAGMSREFLDKIFLPYERETRFGARNISGTGLGMPIVKNIVSQMNGEIYVESKLGEGSVFTVTLPFKRVEERPGEPLSQEAGGKKTASGEPLTQEAGGKETASGEPSTQETGQKQTDTVENALPETESAGDGSRTDGVPALNPREVWEGKKILLAEDNEMNMEIGWELLTMQGAQVEKAWDGQEAVEVFEASAPGEFDLILMDMQMPRMDGCQAARAIRALDRPDAAAIPIIAVTANAFAEDLAATMAAGMNAHVSKPLDFSLLGETFCKLLREKNDGQKNGSIGERETKTSNREEKNK